MGFVVSAVIRTVGDSVTKRGGVANLDQQYTVTGVTSGPDAVAALETYLATVYGPSLTLGSLVLDDITGDEPVENVWPLTAKWRTFERRAPLSEDETEFSFRISGEPVRVRLPIGTIDVFKKAETPAWTPQVLNDVGNQEEPEGVDILEPTYEESVTKIFKNVDLTESYRNKLKRLVGKTNSGFFKGFDAGEVLLMGVSGTRRGRRDSELQFTWQVRENQTNLTVGDITGINKKGWQYLWPKSETIRPSSGPAYKRITHVCVATVYRSGNFADLNI